MNTPCFPRCCLPVLISLILAGCTSAELLQGLDERQANEVVATLLRHNLHAEKRLQGKAGFAVEVGRGELADAIDIVQRQGLPSLPRTQIATQFPADAMVSTPLGERARLFSAIEQRLEESLSTMRDVQQARVHVSYDAGSIEGGLGQRAAPGMHVAALLVHAQDADEQALLTTAKRFLRNAFVDVSYDNVSVILTPAPVPRMVAVTRAEAASGRWQLAVLAALAVLAGIGVAISSKGRAGLAMLRGRLRRTPGADTNARVA